MFVVVFVVVGVGVFVVVVVRVFAVVIVGVFVVVVVGAFVVVIDVVDVPDVVDWPCVYTDIPTRNHVHICSCIYVGIGV